jgi:putative phosphoribosyl transferase
MRRDARFRDRRDAGKQLGDALKKLHLKEPVIYALPRGGVPVGREVADALDAPLDLVLVRKIGHPWQHELALAAVVDGSSPEIVVNEDVRESTLDADKYIAEAGKTELAEIERRRALYLKDRERISPKGRTAIVVDDGIATGATVRAALKALRRQQPEKLILAVPVAPSETIEELRREVDHVICLTMPEPFFAIGLHYEDFAQLNDSDVIASLKSDRKPQAAA